MGNFKLLEIILDKQGNKIGGLIDNGVNRHEYSIESLTDYVKNGNEIQNAEVKDDELFLVPSKAYQSLIGMNVGEWYVREYIGNKKYRCICSCGVVRAVSKYSLTGNESTSCGHKSNNFVDITGQTFGEWTAIEYVGEQHWLCKCSCNNRRKVFGPALRKGLSKSCGHDTNAFIDLTGQTFGEWTVIKYIENHKWLCKCSCKVERELFSQALRNGTTNSCGHDTNAFIDLTDQTFGEWTVNYYEGHGYWNCTCSCSNVRSIKGDALRFGHSKSCGHSTNQFIDLSNKTFGSLSVLEYVGQGYWKCQCSCKNHTITIVRRGSLLSGQTKSCGRCDKSDLELELISNKEKFNSTLLREYMRLHRKLSTTEAAKLFNVSLSYVCKLIHKYEAEDYIKFKVNRSNFEEEIAQFVESLGFNIVRNDRNVLKGKELDIYVPSANLAIEANGTYWHSSEFKSPNYHQKKTELCSENNITLIHIFEHEWLDNNQQIKLKELIKQKLNYQQKIIYARQTEVKQIDYSLAADFINTYHLQGVASCNISYGLYYKNELIEVMTFGVPRYSAEYEVEIIRLCSKFGYKIIGGASKLFKHYLNDYKPSSVISYCDISKFTGSVYKQIGMTYDGITKPGYVYVNMETLETLSRTQCMKSRLISKGLGNESQTEEEIMLNSGFIRVYNCGNKRYVYRRA